MRLRELILKNFRGYGQEVRISFDDLTVLIGKNDVGKSTILEALNTFFNDKDVKLDMRDSCVYTGETENIITIGCTFDDLPESVTIDATAQTKLENEYLLNSEGLLEIHKEFDCSKSTIKGIPYAVAQHPSAKDYEDLLGLKNTDLKSRIKKLAIDTGNVNLASNVEMRQAIWRNCPELRIASKKISLDKGDDMKAIWGALGKHLPIFALFKADRQSSDDDSEIQDPMKLAISEALRESEEKLSAIKRDIQEKVEGVAKATLEKLREMDPGLANELSPNFKAEPKWDGIFKMSLAGDDQIPINKRGSGVRRLILLNFFRAEVERKVREGSVTNVIYAIEEPETAQHPDNQKKIIEALMELANQPRCQILITTHVPGLAKLVPIESIRYITKETPGTVIVRGADQNILEEVAETLGILPNIEDANNLRLIVCVEGKNDIIGLGFLAKCLHESDPTKYVDLLNDPRVIAIPLGGNSLQEWVAKNYLGKIGIPEWHLYDRDTETPPKYSAACDSVNVRGNGHSARLTQKRELENYYHPRVVSEVLQVQVNITDMDDVPTMIARKLCEAEGEEDWDTLKGGKGRRSGKVKIELNCKVAAKMTPELIDEIDQNGEVRNWFQDIAGRLV